MYNWQHKNWPHFEFDDSLKEKELMDFMLKAGVLKGVVSALPNDISNETIVQIMVAEAMKTSEIEGEMLSRIEVMSSIKNNLGISANPLAKDKNIIGLSKMLIDVRNSFSEALTEKKILEWHKMLMENNKKVNAGVWRKHKEPMQVISGSVSNPTIHFEAPPSTQVAKEMKAFVDWYNHSTIKNPLIKSAVAHIYFESIHPFEDGNGRVGRAIAEKALSQGLNSPVLFSISRAIEANKKEYYTELKNGQSGLAINKWIEWFISVIVEAQESSERMVRFTIKKVHFFDKYDSQINERQRKVIKKILEEEFFKGGMNTKKYISITGASKSTATRDLQDLVEMNIFESTGGGRSTSYEIIL
jgi:Fic family protein